MKMPTRKKLTSQSITVVDDMRDYGSSPFVIEKNRKLKAFLDKHGLPEEYTRRRKRID